MRLRTFTLAFALGLGCSRGEPRPDPAPNGDGRASGAETAPSAKAAPKTAQPEAASDNLESYMLEHFVIVTYARDAVITGHLEPLRKALGALADYAYDHVAPGEWRPWITKMQAAARPGASAKTLEAAALAIANTAAVCGDCHVAHRQGPAFPDEYDAQSETGPANTLESRMARHVWVANRMWEGLIAPSDEAWRAGSSELASLPLHPPQEQPALSPEFARKLQQVRELGAAARGAQSTPNRVQIYARVLTTCAQCHEREMTLPF